MDDRQDTEALSQQMESFYQVSQFVDSIDDIEKLLELIMGGAEAACIALYDSSDELLHIKFASGAKRDEVKGVTLVLGQGILGKSAATNSTVRVDTVQEDSRFDSSVDEKTQFPTRSVLVTPIRRRQVLLDVLEVINKRSELAFSESDARLLERLQARPPSPSTMPASSSAPCNPPACRPGVRWLPASSMVSRRR